MISDINGKKITPKQKAAEIIDDYLQDVMDYWIEREAGYGKKYTEKEQELIFVQLFKYRNRILKMLGYEIRE